MTDDMWNDIVQRNAKEFKQENERKHIEKLIKNKAIQEEQMRQIEAKRAMKGVQRQLDKDFFNKIGFQASDKYYLN